MTKPFMCRSPETFLTLTEDHMIEYLIQAQWAEMIEIKKVIHGLARKFRRKLRLLDIGVGDARVARRLSGIEEIWECVFKYDGIDGALRGN